LKALTGWETRDDNATLIPGTDNHGFSALPGGIHVTVISTFWDVGIVGNWWSATEFENATTTQAWSRSMYSMGHNVDRGDLNKSTGLSLRCVRDD
jgi:uncharacterized protein (TIGR02145 family)